MTTLIEVQEWNLSEPPMGICRCGHEREEHLLDGGCCWSTKLSGCDCTWYESSEAWTARLDGG